MSRKMILALVGIALVSLVTRDITAAVIIATLVAVGAGTRLRARRGGDGNASR